jgi:hypothetical protein
MISRVSKTDSAVLRSLDLESHGVDVLFAQHGDRLKRMVHLRISRRLAAQVDYPHVIQEA